MSLVNVPSKEEVMRWSPQNLADYMRQLNLSSCDRVVLNRGMTGAQFMITQSQLEVFPSLHVSTLRNIRREIMKGEQRMAFGSRSNTQKRSKKVCAQVEEVWEDSDGVGDDYEWSEVKTREETYICPSVEQYKAEKLRSGGAGEGNNMLPGPSLPVKAHRSVEGRDCPRVFYSDVKNYSSTKPGQLYPSQATSLRTKGSAAQASGSSRQSRASGISDVLNRTCKLPPAPPPVPVHLAKLNKSTAAPKKRLDASWYRGQLTRHQAELALRAVNKDGTFLVRDGSKGSAEQPYTLMLLNGGKVYNIRIRHQGNSYMLGNGVNSTMSFPGVKEMIIHHMSTPLLLVNAADQSSAEKPQCCLLHPAGL